MPVTVKSQILNAAGGALVPGIAAAMCLPIVMFSLMGYDINPAFVLAPFIAIALLMNFGRTGLAYLSAGVMGLISIMVANKVSADGELIKHVFSMVLIMFAPSFLFLGKYISKSSDISRVFYWLSLFSSLFLIVVAARIFYLEQDVRIYLGPFGLAAMNAEFLGLPVFATFGVLSLAYLVCLQAMIICGTLIAGKTNKAVSLLMWVALFCATFLIIGSDSRSAQVLLVWIVGSIVFYAIRNSDYRRNALIAIIAVVIAFAVTYARGMDGGRMVNSIEAISAQKHWKKKADEFATGRIELAIEGVKEVVASPIIGSGFSGYGRYSTEGKSQALIANTSTHIYYLTLLWKGGLIFFIPFMAMILLNLKSAITGTRMTEKSPERFFAWAAVLMAFGPMAMAWDILIVPSAGAVAFFLFGLLGGLKNQVQKV